MNDKRALLEGIGDYLTAPRLPRPVMEKVAGSLIDRYADEPWRFYHIIAHLGHMGGFLLKHVDQLENPRVVFWSALVHDSIYVPSAPKGVNENLSAQLGGFLLNDFLPSGEGETIERNTRATVDHRLDGLGSDSAFFLDSDLIILGETDEVFDEYDDNIGLEYLPYFEPADYKVGRRLALGHLAQINPLYNTEAARALYGDQAQHNFERKLSEPST